MCSETNDSPVAWFADGTFQKPFKSSLYPWFEWTQKYGKIIQYVAVLVVVMRVPA